MPSPLPGETREPQTVATGLTDIPAAPVRHMDRAQGSARAARFEFDPPTISIPMTDTDTSALETIVDGLGDFSAAVILRVRDGVQFSDFVALLDEFTGFGKMLYANVREAGAEITDLDFDDGVALASALVNQAPKIRRALTGGTPAA